MATSNFSFFCFSLSGLYGITMQSLISDHCILSNYCSIPSKCPLLDKYPFKESANYLNISAFHPFPSLVSTHVGKIVSFECPWELTRGAGTGLASPAMAGLLFAHWRYKIIRYRSLKLTLMLTALAIDQSTRSLAQALSECMVFTTPRELLP